MVVAIIQARLASTRLPRKVLADIGGFSMLEHVYGRVEQSKLIDQIVVAVPLKDKELIEYCTRRHWAVYPGHETDVLSRYWGAARAYKADTVVRVTADCPLIDPSLIDNGIRAFKAHGVDFLALNIGERTFPHGLEFEVMKYDTLREAHLEAGDAGDSEHVSPFIRKHPERFKLYGMKLDVDWSRHRITVDTEEDLELVRAIVDAGAADSTRRVVEFLEQRESHGISA